MCRPLLLAFVALNVALLLLYPWPPPASHATLPSELRPYRPPLLNLANGILSPLNALRLPSLRAEDMLASAEFFTGLSEWDDSSGMLRIGFAQLGAALESESNLTAVGRVFARVQLQAAMHARLRIVAHAAADPSVGSLAVSAPVFILGKQQARAG